MTQIDLPILKLMGLLENNIDVLWFDFYHFQDDSLVWRCYYFSKDAIGTFTTILNTVIDMFCVTAHLTASKIASPTAPKAVTSAAVS